MLALQLEKVKPCTKRINDQLNFHCKREAFTILTQLEERLNETSKALAKACIENTKYEVKLRAQRALDESTIEKLEASRRASGTLNVVLAREVVIRSHVDILKQQNTSLQGEVAKIASIEYDLSKIRSVLHKAELNHHNIVEESDIYKLLLKEAPRREDAEFLRISETSSILKDKAEISCVR